LPAPVGGQRLVVGDFAAPDVLAQVGDSFDVILLHDSLYYVGDVPGFLRRLPPLLAQQGLIIVRIHDRFRYAPSVDDIHGALAIVEERAPADERRILIAARGRENG
jgi:hypothetical protein